MGGGIRVCLNFSPALFPNCKPIKSGLWCCPDPNKTTIHEFTDQVRTHFKLPVDGPASLQLLWNKQYTLPEDGIVADLVRDGEVLDVLPASQPLNEAIAALNRATSDPSRQDDNSLGAAGKAPSGLLLDGPAAFAGDAQAAAGGVADSTEGAAPPLDPTLTMYMQAFLQGVTLQTMQGAPPGAAGLVANASKNGGLAGGLGLRGPPNVDEDGLPRDVTDAEGGNPLKRKHSMNGGRYPQSPGQAESSQDTVDAGAAEDEDDPEYHPGMTRDSPTRPRPAKRRSMKGREGQSASGNGLNGGGSSYSNLDPIGLQALISGDGSAPAMPGLGLEQLAEAAALAALQPGGAQASQALLSLQGLSQAMPQAAGARQAGNDPEVDEPGTSGTSSKAKTGEMAVTSSGRPRKPSQKALTSGDDDDDILGKKSSGGGGVSKESSGKCLITLDRLRQVYHLNIEDAAKELGIGMTKLKEHCRQLGIPRWPSRKLRSMDKLIESLGERAHLDPHTQQVVEDVIRELARFKQMIYEDPSIEVEEEIKRLRQSNFKKEYQQRQQLARQVPGTSSGGSLGGLAALGGVPRPQSPVFDKSVLSFDRSQAQFDPTRANITFDPARAPQAFADLTRHSSYDLQ